MTKRLVSTYKVKDSKGNIHTLHKRQEIVAVPHIGDASATIEGLFEYNLASGHAVNALDDLDDTFEIVSTGEKLARI